MAAKKMPAKKMPAKKVAAKKPKASSSESPGGGEAARRKKSQAAAQFAGAQKNQKSGMPNPYGVIRGVAGALGGLPKVPKNTVKGVINVGRGASRVLPGIGSLVTMSPSDAIKKAKKGKK